MNKAEIDIYCPYLIRNLTDTLRLLGALRVQTAVVSTEGWGKLNNAIRHIAREISESAAL